MGGKKHGLILPSPPPFFFLFSAVVFFSLFESLREQDCFVPGLTFFFLFLSSLCLFSDILMNVLFFFLSANGEWNMEGFFYFYACGLQRNGEDSFFFSFLFFFISDGKGNGGSSKGLMGKGERAS